MFTSGQQSALIARSYSKGWLHAGVPPSAAVAPIALSLIVGLASPHPQRPSFLWSGNAPLAERTELYRTAIVPDNQPHRPGYGFRFLWPGNNPLPEQTELYRTAIIPQSKQDPSAYRSGFLWRGNVPANVVVANVIPLAAAIIDQVAGKNSPSVLWPGNIPRAEQPELYRLAIVPGQSESRDALKQPFLWPGNAPLPEQTELYRSAIVPESRQNPSAYRPGFTWPGNLAAGEQPELYRQLVIGREQPRSGLGTLHAGVQPANVVLGIPKLDSLFVRQRIPERPNESELWPGNNPNNEQPELYRVLVIGQERPRDGSGIAQIAGLISLPQVPKLDALFASQSIPERVNPSRVHAGNLPIPEQIELYRSIVIVQEQPRAGTGILHSGVQPDSLAPKLDALFIVQRVPEQVNLARLRPGNQPQPEQPELYGLIVQREWQPDKGRFFARHFVPPDVFVTHGLEIFRIPAEDRTLVVPAEDRIYRVPHPSRG